MCSKTRCYAPLFYGLLSALAVFLPSCASVSRPMTEKEMAVTIKEGDQQTTLDLNSKCKPIGRIAEVSDNNEDDEIRILGAANNANVAQVLYTHDKMRDVRFWSCP